MSRLAPSSRMTNRSQSVQRQGAGFDPISLGSWSHDSEGREWHTSQLEYFSSPLDHLDILGPVGYGGAGMNALTQTTLDGSMTLLIF